MREVSDPDGSSLPSRLEPVPVPWKCSPSAPETEEYEPAVTSLARVSRDGGSWHVAAEKHVLPESPGAGSALRRTRPVKPVGGSLLGRRSLAAPRSSVRRGDVAAALWAHTAFRRGLLALGGPRQRGGHAERYWRICGCANCILRS